MITDFSPYTLYLLTALPPISELNHPRFLGLAARHKSSMGKSQGVSLILTMQDHVVGSQGLMPYASM